MTTPGKRGSTRFDCITPGCPGKVQLVIEAYCPQCKRMRPPLVLCRECSTPYDTVHHEEGKHVRLPAKPKP